MIDVVLDVDLGVLDALGNLHLLLAGEQGNLAHLLEIHPHRVIKDVEFRLGFFLFLFGVVGLFPVLHAIHLRRLDDFDLHAA